MFALRAFRAIRTIGTRILATNMRIGAPLVVANNYLRLYNLNLFHVNLFLEQEEEEDEVM